MRIEWFQKIQIALYECVLDLKLAAITGSAISIFFKKSKHSNAE
jgi:hypothetical protein